MGGGEEVMLLRGGFGHCKELIWRFGAIGRLDAVQRLWGWLEFIGFRLLFLSS